MESWNQKEKKKQYIRIYADAGKSFVVIIWMVVWQVYVKPTGESRILLKLEYLLEPNPSLFHASELVSSGGSRLKCLDISINTYNTIIQRCPYDKYCHIFQWTLILPLQHILDSYILLLKKAQREHFANLVNTFLEWQTGGECNYAGF